MDGGHNLERLKAHILPLSESKDFNTARQEWMLTGVELHEEWDNCPCGQDIKELCHIKNQINGNKAYVGNVCINRFIGIQTGNLFDGLKRIAQNPKANVNQDLIMYAFKLGYLYDENELKFLMETRNMRNLSPAQISWKEKINRRILNHTVVKKGEKSRRL
jgi:hypothetical protein